MSSMMFESEPSLIPRRGHMAQFYEDERYLFRAVADFVEPALRTGEPVLMIATEPHRRELASQLAGRGFDLDQAARRGELTILDARETLARFMRHGAPDGPLFRASVGAVITALRHRHAGNTPVRAYGEMVDLLWREDQPQAALALEEQWNDLASAHPLSLLCAYTVGGFLHAGNSGALAPVRPLQQGVWAARSPLRGGTPPRGSDGDGELARLRARTRALEAELRGREEMEKALRDALAERRRAEVALRGSEQTLRLRNEELARAVHFSEMFVGILGHDLRNPLSAVTTAARLLARRADSDRVAKPTARILSSAERMARMIDQLLDFTRMRLGQGIPLVRAPTDLESICRLAIDEIEEGCVPPRVTLDVAGDSVGMWDADRLAQLASNLIGNALAHGATDGPVRVRIDGSAPASVVLVVENAGAIAADLLPVLFQPLRVCKDRKPCRSNGLGLGLYISQQIAAAHGGRIAVTSSAAAGTRMSVSLPRDPAAALAGPRQNSRTGGRRGDDS